MLAYIHVCMCRMPLLIIKAVKPPLVCVVIIQMHAGTI